MMNADHYKQVADDVNAYYKNEDYLDDRVIDGIYMDITEESNNGNYSFVYDKTAGLTKKDLRYCKNILIENGFEVIADYNMGTLQINW